MQVTAPQPGNLARRDRSQARTLAAELVVAPLTAHSLAKGIEWFTGCGITGLHRPANKMLLTWSRIGHMKIPMG
jgi:hypothetical protein